MDLQLKGKTAVVTGASRGIGRAIAELFADEGANVAICARNGDEVTKVVKRLAAKGVKAWGQEVDVADPVALKGWVEGAASELGGIADIVVMQQETVHVSIILAARREGREEYRVGTPATVHPLFRPFVGK